MKLTANCILYFSLLFFTQDEQACDGSVWRSHGRAGAHPIHLLLDLHDTS